jgi:iron complex outermembrane receptor protein
MSIALLAQPVFAQGQVGDDQTVDEEASIADAGAADEETLGQDEASTIIVTGSSIRRTVATSSSPLHIIDPVISRRSGNNETAEIIQNSPIASGSTQINSAISVNAQGTNGGPGAQTVSLRGLGAERTLVLLNSRRAGPAGTRGGVSSFDLGVLPSSIIESVEILKDGASSVYGSDAIAGVVNIITKTDTDGLELDGFVSVPFEEGGEEFQISGAWGKDFGRGNILIAGEFYRQNIMRRQDRDFLSCDYDYLFRSETSDERVDLIDPRTGTNACDGTTWGHVWAYKTATRGRNLPDNPTLMQYNYDLPGLGGLERFIPGLTPATRTGDLIAPPGWFPVSYQTTASNSVVNGYHPFEAKSSAIPETNRYTGYAQANFDVTDTLKVYAEGLFNRRETYHDTYSQFYNFGYTDQYAPGDPDDPFPGFHGLNGRGVFLSPTGILDNYDQQINVDYYRGVLGIQGDITDRIGFDLHGQYSKSDGTYQLDQILQDSITQQTDRAYGYGCAGLFTEITNKACLQINWTDPRVMYGDLTPAEEAYLTGTEIGRTIYTQKFVEGSVSGEVFELPAGWVGVAAGAVIREDAIDDLPGDITRALVPGGDPNNEEDYVNNAFSNDFASGHTYGKSITKEAFAEIEIPILRDQPFAESFTISGAARITNVKATRGSDNVSDESNGNFTYKVMANWQVTDWVRLRATYGTSFRAPALFEQFLASQVSSFRQSTVDPCVQFQQNLDEGNISDRVAANCAADGVDPDHTGAGLPAEVFSSGGLGVLEPETSRSWTASVIFTPTISFLPDTDIDLTIDYFDIAVKDEISQLTGYQILYGCYDAEDFPTSPYCSFFTRGADGDPQNVATIERKFINVDEQVNRGFDFTLRASHNFGRLGKLSLLAQSTLQTKDTITTLGTLENLNGELGDPKFTADINLVWDFDDWSLFYGVDVIGSWSSAPDYIEDNGGLCQTTGEFIAVYGGPYCVRPYAEAKVYHSASITKEFMDRFELTFGVANLFDSRPPEVSGVTELGSSPFVSQYDWLGRRLFVNVGAKF